MAGWASVTSCWYWSLSVSARLTASIRPWRAVTATITTGKTVGIPKTAISTPTVRKIFCQKALIFFRIPALTTALSKDSEISRMARITTMPKAVHPVDHRCDQAERGDRKRPAEGFQKHWLPNHRVCTGLPRAVLGFPC